jgi:hypothetical protein
LFGESPAVLNALIGSALSLISTSIFLLYFANILEPRGTTRGSHWRMMWEIGVIPFVMLLAIGLAATFGPSSRWAWAGITAFMLLGAMTLAYGLLYRGLFRELEYASRAVAERDRDIESISQRPKKEQPDRAEQRELDRVLSDYRIRRQGVLDLDRERRLRRMLLTSDESDPALLAAHPLAVGFVGRMLVRWRRVGAQADFYRVTDLEAAPVETAERKDLEQQIRALDLELKTNDPEAARLRLREREQEHEKARTEKERAERAQPQTLAETDEREAVEDFDFEGAFALGSSTKPAYDIVAMRRNDTIQKAQRRRPQRPARPQAPHGPEVTLEH